MTKKTAVRCLVLLLALSAIPAARVVADGAKAESKTYRGLGKLQGGQGTARFSITTSPLIFYLGTLNNKYRLLEILVQNDASVPLRLFKESDTVELDFYYRRQHEPMLSKVKGILNLPEADPAPGGHFKIPHPWPGQIPPLDSGGTGDDYALTARLATFSAASLSR